MGAVKVFANSPAELTSWTSVQDGWKEFANTLYGQDTCWVISKGIATSSCGLDNRITKNQITFTTRGQNPTQTLLTGKFKFSKKHKSYPFLDLKGIVTGYESKIFASGTWYDGDEYTHVKTDGLKTKINKVLSRNLESVPNSPTPLYAGDSFINDGIIGYSKNTILNSNISTFAPSRTMGKTFYSIIDSPGKSRTWQVKLGTSKDTVDLTQLGDDDLKIIDFDLKKDKLVIDGDYFVMKQAGAYEGVKLYSGNTKEYQGMVIPGDNSKLMATFYNSGINGSINPQDDLNGITITNI